LWWSSKGGDNDGGARCGNYHGNCDGVNDGCGKIGGGVGDKLRDEEE
jgi:hypothetical protein